LQTANDRPVQRVRSTGRIFSDRPACRTPLQMGIAMDTHKPAPLYAAPNRKVCPICGKSTYSMGGIHPQCAVQQADAPRQRQLAAERKERERLQAEAK
jgi:hypothetical protein